jgi:5-formyltetrahydrofolate cyclo-ligase
MATKAELRTHFLALRRSLSTDLVDKYSQLVTATFFNNPIISKRLKSLARPCVLHTFLPIKRQNEVDTWLIINKLWQDYPHVQIAVSVTDSQLRQLAHYVLTPKTRLADNRWGIPEPIIEDRRDVSSYAINIVLVPLLGFDYVGHRVGYGGGFYDRFLAECRPDCLKIGLSFFEPVDSIDDIESTDIPLNLCITPSQCLEFN